MQDEAPSELDDDDVHVEDVELFDDDPALHGPAGARGLALAKKVEWLELLFDLVFVVVVHQIAVPLEDQALTAGRTLRFCLRVFCVWWIWHSMSFVRDAPTPAPTNATEPLPLLPLRARASRRAPSARAPQLLNMSLTLFGRLHARHDAVVLLLMGALAFLVSSASAEIDDDFGFLLCYLFAR